MLAEISTLTSRRVSAEREPKSISPTLRDTLGVVLLLASNRLCDLLLIQVASVQLLVQFLERQALNHVNRVNDVAQALAHFPSVGITNHGMAIDLLEGHLSSEVDSKHDHASDPEENDIPSSLQHGRGVEVLQVGGLVGPAHDGEGPEARGEPGVEDVLVLLQLEGLASSKDLGALERLLLGAADDPVLAVVRILVLALDVDIVCRAAVSPPELTRDTPVLDTLEPAVPLVLGCLGLDEEFAGTGTLDGFLGQGFAVDPPLRLEERLNNVSRLVTDGDLHGVVLGLNVEAEFLELFDDLVPGMETLHALEFLAGVGIESTIVIEDVDKLEVVSLADFVIVGIVRGSDLDGTSSELHVNDDRVLNNGDAPVDEGMDGELAMEVGVARVIGVDSDGGITEHGLGTGGGDDDFLIGAFDGIGEAGEDTKLETLLGVVARNVEKGAARELLLVDFEVGDGRVEFDTPVDEAVGAVKNTVFVEAAEGLDDGLGELGVHGERDAIPVVATTKAMELAGDSGLVLILPVHDGLEECLASEDVSRLALLLEEALLDHTLGGDASVVESGNEEGSLSEHAVPSNQAVLDSSGEGVADVQTSGDVGRRTGNDEGFRLGLAVGTILGLKETLSRPPVVPTGFDRNWVVASSHRLGKICSLSDAPRRRR